MSELSDRLGEAYHQKDGLDAIWDATIKPWGNKEGFDIRLRVVCSTGDERLFAVIKALEKILCCAFEKSDDTIRADWKSNVRIYIGT